MNRTVTVEPLGCLGDVPTQNDTVLSAAAGVARALADGFGAAACRGGWVDVQPANVTATVIATTAVPSAARLTVSMMPVSESAHEPVAQTPADGAGLGVRPNPRDIAVGCDHNRRRGAT